MNTAGDDRSSATSASLYQPTDVAVQSGAVYIADSGNHRIRRLWWNGIIETTANADMTQGGVIDMTADGAVVFTDDRFASMVPDRTVESRRLEGMRSILWYVTLAALLGDLTARSISRTRMAIGFCASRLTVPQPWSPETEIQVSPAMADRLSGAAEHADGAVSCGRRPAVHR